MRVLYRLKIDFLEKIINKLEMSSTIVEINYELASLYILRNDVRDRMKQAEKNTFNKLVDLLADVNRQISELEQVRNRL